MVIVMKPGATEDQVQHVVQLVRDYGLKEHLIYGTDRTVVACIGDKRMVDKGAIENAPMVEQHRADPRPVQDGLHGGQERADGHRDRAREVPHRRPEDRHDRRALRGRGPRAG